MADEQLSAELELDIAAALTNVDQLGTDVETALGRGADSFSTAMADAVASVPDVEVEPDVSAVEPAIADAFAAVPDVEVDPDVSAVEPAISSAVDAADAEVPIEATGAESITSDIDAAVGSADSSVAVDADTSSATASVDELVASVVADTPMITVDADTSAATEAVDELSASVDEASGAMDAGTGSANSYAGATGAAGAASDLASGSAVGLGSAIGEVGGGAGAAVGVVAALGAGIGIMYNEAVEATGATQRFESTLGTMADRVENLDSINGLNTNLGDLALTLGSDDDKIRNVVARLFELATASGISENNASEFVQQMVAMGARAVALNPELGDVGDVTDALSTALVRGGRFASKYGLDLNQTEINARALNDTHKHSTAELSFVEKAMAGAALASEKYGGNLETIIAEGSENAITKQRRLAQTIRENVEALGLPLVAPIFEVIEAAIPITQVAGELLSSLAQGVIPLLTIALDTATPGLQLISDILNALPAPIVGAGAAFLGLRATLGPLFAPDGMIFQGGQLVGKLSGVFDTAGGRMAAAAGGAILATDGFDRVGGSAANTAVGIGEMAAGGALLGATLGSVIPGAGTAAGAAIGAVAGTVLGATKAVFASGQSLDEYRQQFEKLGAELDNLTARDAALKFFDKLGDADLIGGASGNVRLLTDELRSLASTSPAAAAKVVEGFIAMREESGKPLSHAQIDALNAAVDRGTTAYQKHVVEQQKSRTENEGISAAATAAAQAETNQAAATQVGTDALAAHSTALSQTTTAYQAATLAAQGQAEADANSALVAQQQALATRSTGDAAAAASQSHLTLGIAIDGAVAANLRYLSGQGTAKEATDATSLAVSTLRNELSLLEGNYLGSVGAGLTLQQQFVSFDANLYKFNGTLGTTAAEILSSQQSLVGMGNAALAASSATAQNGETLYAQIAPLVQYQSQLDLVRSALAAAGDSAGVEFVDKLAAANQRAIDNLTASAPEFQNSGSAAAGAGAAGVASQAGAFGAAGSAGGAAGAGGVAGQGGAFAGAGQGVGAAGTAGLAGGLAGMPGVASGSVLESVNAAALAGANAHNVGYGIGAAFIEGIADGADANSTYLSSTLSGIVNTALASAKSAAEIGSPSKLFAREVGLPIAQGVALGIDKGASYVDRAGAGLINASSPFVPGIGGPGRGGGGGINIVVEVNGVSDPAEAKRAGENAGEGIATALIRRGVVVATRTGG